LQSVLYYRLKDREVQSNLSFPKWKAVRAFFLKNKESRNKTRGAHPAEHLPHKLFTETLDTDTLTPSYCQKLMPLQVTDSFCYLHTMLLLRSYFITLSGKMTMIPKLAWFP